jgi:hypothetical protein
LRGDERRKQPNGDLVSIVTILIIVLLVVLVLGFLGRGRFRA